MSPAPWAEIWPSRLALEERRRQLAAQAGGLLLEERLFTFQGRYGLFEGLFREMPPMPGHRPLPELAGPLLLHHLLRQPGQPLGLFQGLTAGRRLPYRLWRLLVQIKGAGLGAVDLRKLGQARSSPRLIALAQLLDDYQTRLDKLGLADESDLLAGLEAWLTQAGRPALLAGWAGLEVRQSLWLRPLDLRLLAALSRLLAVRVNFALSEPPRDPGGGVYGLLAATARSLEAGHAGDLKVIWRGPSPGPLADLAASALDPQASVDAVGAGCLELRRLAGRYAEVEVLARRALELVEAGVPAHKLAIVFPDLSLYGPLTADVAARLGLPVYFRRGRPLAAAPLAQALLELLALPLRDYARAELAQVWESPYLARPLAAWLLGPGQEPPGGAGLLLTRAGYVDGREITASACLRRAAERGQASPALERLAQACEALQGQLRGLGLERLQTLDEYALALGRLLERLDLAGQGVLPAPPGLGGGCQAGHPACPGGQAVAVRDLAAWQGLLAAQRELALAAILLEGGEGLSPGRCLALFREMLAGQEVAEGQGQAGGVPVLRLEDAQGLRPHTLLIGGLSQGDFPQRPAQHLLSHEERLNLGRRAGLPVWRTEEEEYGGQVLRLVLLLSSAREGALLTSPAADASGHSLSPAFILADLARRLGQELEAPGGGIYGQLPPLPLALEPLALWSGLARDLLRPGALVCPEQDLARAVLAHLTQDAENQERWQDIQERATVEEARAAWDLLEPAPRLAASDAFGGRLASLPARERLALAFAAPERRHLSPSALELYASCPWSWLMWRLLRLAPEDQPGWDLQGRVEGDWVHRALALFFAPEEFDPSWDQAARAQRLERCLDQARQELALAGRPGHDLAWSARRQSLLASLSRVVEGEWPQMAGLRPLGVELDLGPEGQGLPLAVDDGPPLFLRGRLDRLDQGPGRLRLTDYKHTRNEALIRQTAYPPRPGRNTPAGDPPLGAVLQILLYLAATAKTFLREGEVLEGRLLNTRCWWQKPAYTRGLEPGDGLLIQERTARQTLAAAGQPNLFNHIQGLWQALAGGDLTPRPTADNCRYCEFVLACRARPVAGGAEGEGAAGDA